MAKRDALKRIEEERGVAMEREIPRLLNKYKNRQGVADDLGVHINTIHRWLRSHPVQKTVVIEYEPLEVAHDLAS